MLDVEACGRTQEVVAVESKLIEAPEPRRVVPWGRTYVRSSLPPKQVPAKTHTYNQIMILETIARRIKARTS